MLVVRQACADVNIHHKQYLSWKREYSSIENAQNPKAKSRSAGHDSILKPIEQDLLRYIFELREQGIGVKIDMVMRRAAAVSRVFRDKSPNITQRDVLPGVTALCIECQPMSRKGIRR
jgi:hypothetical protein